MAMGFQLASGSGGDWIQAHRRRLVPSVRAAAAIAAGYGGGLQATVGARCRVTKGCIFQVSKHNVSLELNAQGDLSSAKLYCEAVRGSSNPCISSLSITEESCKGQQ
ncbi:unnamed protein product [Miscanthus lutarioriparius]|uniref:Uncharacterized protein n=1 Tax=Miscanthus lutarioriparius TaxID=422564 RepID=A0A811S7I5_9POAL|nr:unnamed protein product [Miscanthus lutarioriparius]